MNIQFLEKLSNADGIASNEQEVRDVLVAELKEYADEVSTDHLGSIIFSKKRESSAMCGEGSLSSACVSTTSGIMSCSMRTESIVQKTRPHKIKTKMQRTRRFISLHLR